MPTKSDDETASAAESYRRRLRIADDIIGRLRVRLRMGKFDEAFRIGERLLDAAPLTETYDWLLCPLEMHGAQGRILPPFALYDLLEKLRTLRRKTAHPSWYAMLETDLLEKLGRTPEAFAAAERLSNLPARYGWMSHNRGIMLLRLRQDFAQSRREFDSVLRSAPVFWKASACAAEAALCQGDDAGAFETMEGLVANLRGEERTAALAWRGELRLWRADYEGALIDLDEALLRGSRTALCWRAGARLKLGRVEEAVADLDHHLGRSPRDIEALIWRGEAKRLQGRREESLLDLETAVRLGQNPLWALVNRALLRAAHGDARGMWSDYRMLPRAVRARYEWELRVSTEDERRPEDGRAVLEAILSAGAGIRQSEYYLFAIWMR